MPQQPQDPWGVVSVGGKPAAQPTAAPANPNAPSANAGTPNDPWAVVQVGNQPTNTPAPQGGTTPAAQPPLDGNGQPIVHSAPGAVKPTATISAYNPTWLDRIENMFSDYRRTESGIGKYIPSYHPLKEGEGMQILRPENIMTETEKKNHPMATAIGEFGGEMTSPQMVGLTLATEGASTAYPLVEEALTKIGLKGLSAAGRAIAPRLLAGGFSLQMLKGAYDKFPQIRDAWNKGDESEVKRLFTHMVLDSSMAFLAGKHAVKGGEVAGGGQTQYEKAQEQLRKDEIAVGGQPPAEPAQPAAPEAQPEPEKPNTFRPTTQNIAGVDVPVTAAQAAPEGPGFITRMAQKFATPGQAAKFQAERTRPAGVQAVVSALSQSAEDKIARHEALVNGDAVPEPISGTDEAGRYSDPDRIWEGMQRAAEPTWQKAREASNRELQQWEQQKKDIIDTHKMGIDQHNSVVDQTNQSLSPGEAPMERVQFDPNDVPNMPERPVTFDELRDAVRTAKERAKGMNGISFEDQTKARQVELPKAEKNLDKWMADHSDVVSPEEFDSAKKLHADSIAYQDMSNYLRTKLAKGNLTGGDIRGLEAKINGNAIKERGQQGIDSFKRLVGGDVYQNLQDVAKLFDPIDKQNPLKSWGSYVAEYAIGGLLGTMLHAGTGLVGGIAAKAASEAFMNKLLFDPEFGSTFGKVVEATKSAFSAGRQVPNDLMAKLIAGTKDVFDKITSSEEGAAGANITRRSAGSPVPPKFGRKGLGSAPETSRLTPVSTETHPDYKMATRDNGDIEMQHPNGDSQMVLHPEPDPRAGHEGQTQLRQTGISAVDHPGAGQEMMDEAVNRLNGSEKYSRVISDFPDRRSQDNERHWDRLSKRGHNVQSEPSTDSFGQPWESEFDLPDAQHPLNPGDGGRSYYIDMKPSEAGFPEAKVEEKAPERKPMGNAEGVTGHNPDSEISTRMPSTGTEKAGTYKIADNNPQDHLTGMDAIKASEEAKPGYMQDVLDKVLSYKNNGLKLTPEEMADPEKGLNAVVKHWADNLTWLHDNMPPELRDIAKRWYDSAYTMANDIAGKYGTTKEKVAASIAALSPQNPWDMNVGQAERVVKMYQTMQDHPFTPEMDSTVSSEITRAMKDERPEYADMLKSIRGKTIAELAGKPYEQATLMRILDQTHGNPQTPVYAPDGNVRAYQTFSWGLIDPMVKSIEILSGDGSPQSIHEVLGDGHKIRNFYNNIVSPNSPLGHATIDTHHVNADMLKPMSSKNDVEVQNNFGGSPKIKSTGVQGTYNLHHEALKQAAAQRGLLPREMQSIVWEGIRTLMGESKKKAMRPLVDAIWQQYQTGALTLNEARAKIVKAAGGFQKPIWAKGQANAEGLSSGSNEAGGSAEQPGDVSVLGVRGQTPGATRPGSGSVTPEAVPSTGAATGAEDAFKAVRKVKAKAKRK